VGVHPHRGFETVTLAFEGSVAHADSTGSKGVINPGDVQWMTAAGGILHSEYHEENFAKKGGNLHMLQLWVNLPAAVKMSRPKYQTLLEKDMSKVQLPDNGGTVYVIAGEYNGIKGSASTFTPVNMFRALLTKGHTISFTIPQQHNTTILMVGGSAEVNEEKIVKENDMVVFTHSGETITVKAVEDTQFVVLSGEPINEPIVQYGPFVMNTRQDIQQAIEDFNNGKFGVLSD
jgi:redox-sensitive bicupin YhaK (pirin superfamily)